MTEAKVSSKTPTTTTKKSKGEKEREVIGRIKDLLPQWEVQKVEAFCAEHGHDLEKIHQALDGSFERTGHQPDDWQVMTKKEQKPKRGGRDGGSSREPRASPREPREDRPRGERGESRGGRGRGGGDSRGGRGRGGGDRRGGRGGAGGRTPRDNAGAATADSTTTSEQVPETWGASTDSSSTQVDTKLPESTNTTEWGASSSPVSSTSAAPAPSSSAVTPRVTESAPLTWAQKFAAKNAPKTKIVEQSVESQSQQSQQVPGPAVVHVQPAAQTGPSYRAALQGNTRWGKKAEPTSAAVAEPETSMVPLEQQTAALSLEQTYQPSDSYAQSDNTNNNNNTTQETSSDLLNSISSQNSNENVTSSFPQAEAFQPEQSFQQSQQQQQPQADATSFYGSSNQSSSNAVSEPKSQSQQSTIYSQTGSTSASDFNNLHHQQSSYSSADNGGKLVIDLLSASNNVILPHADSQSSYDISFGSFGQPAQTTNFAPVQPEPVQQPESKPTPVIQQQQQPSIEQTPTESQSQLSQPFANTLREDSLPSKQTSSTDNSSSQFSAQNQFYQSQNQQAQQSVPPPSQSQSQSQQPSSGYRGGPPPSGAYDPPHYAYPFPGYENTTGYYTDFASRDSQQPQSYQQQGYDQYSAQFRGGSAAGGASAGNRRPTSNTNQPYYPSPTSSRGGLLSGNGAVDGSAGSSSPPTSEPVSPNSASKSAPFSSKPTGFAATKPAFNNATKIPPQIPAYTTNKPTGAPSSAGGYNSKPPATTNQPAQKSFKPPTQQQQQGSQSQHHPDPQHYMYPPNVYAGYHYPPYYQAPGQPMPPGFMPQMPYAPYDPRYGGYAYPGPVQPFDGEYEYPKQPAHYSEGGTTPRGAADWNGGADGQKPSNNASAPSAAPSSNSLPSSLNSAKNTVAPGAKKPARGFEYEQDPHFNNGYGFPGAPASSPMAIHAGAAPYQPSSYGQPLHTMGGQAPYGGQYDHPRGYAAAGSWQ